MFYYLNPRYNIWEKSCCSNPFCLKFRKALGPLGKTKSPNINTGNSQYQHFQYYWHNLWPWSTLGTPCLNVRGPEAFMNMKQKWLQRKWRFTIFYFCEIVFKITFCHKKEIPHWNEYRLSECIFIIFSFNDTMNKAELTLYISGLGEVVGCLYSPVLNTVPVWWIRGY